MPVNDPKDIFLLLLSNVRQGTETTTKAFQELSQAAKDPDVKAALDARVFISNQIIARLDQVFKILGAQPVKPSGDVVDTFVENFRKTLGEIQSPVARNLFILSKAVQLIHLRIGEYVALTTAADMTGHYDAGVLLETCLADKLALADRTRRLIRHMIETKVTERIAA